MDEYDEFGNYIGADVSDVEEEFEESNNGYGKQRQVDVDDENDDDEYDGALIERADDQRIDVVEENRIILHEDKKYYPDAEEIYPGVRTVTLDEDAQDLNEPIIKPVKQKDEQERHLSIKSNVLSLVLDDLKEKSYFLNVVDTPGHVNFTDEATAGIRSVDGAVVIVDAIEGVMLNTERLLKQAVAARLPITLVINKMDRLILELKLPPADAYLKLIHTIEEVNGIIANHALSGSKLGIRIKGSEFHLDPRPLLVLSLRRFFGPPQGFVSMIARHIPSPVDAAAYKTTALASSMKRCSSGSDAPLMANVAKLYNSPDGTKFHALTRIYSGT
eukprot:gene9226-11847_t